MAGEFSSIGNLAFYDDWSPDYVYFRSLLHAGTVYESENSGWWDAHAAEEVAQKAIANANTFSILGGRSKEEMDAHFLQKINEIIKFLEQAYKVEMVNEAKWANEKIITMKQLFTDEFKAIPEVTEIINMFQNISHGLDYNKFNALINIIMHGVKNAKIISEYEGKRIQEINQVMESLTKSRYNQTKSLMYSKRKSVDKQEESASAAVERLRNSIYDEYKKTGHLNRQEKVTVKNKDGSETKKTKYVIFGGRQFDSIQKTVDSTISNWAQRMIQDIVQDPELISQISAILEANLSSLITSNFKLLEDNIRQTIIITVIRYAENNLTTILNNKISDSLLNELEKDLLNNTTLFDTTSRLDIMGLNGSNYGQKIQEAALTNLLDKPANDILGYATELFHLVDKLISTTKKSEQQKTLLYQILNDPNSTSNRDWAYINDVIHLIHSIEKVKQESQEMLTKWKKTAIRKRQDLSKEIKLSEKAQQTITIKIVHGTIIIDQAEINKALEENPIFQQMNFKSFNAKNLRYTITQLKRKASLELKKDITAYIKAGHGNLNESEIISSLRTELQDLQIKIDPASVAELLNSIALKLTNPKSLVDMNGKISGKNDGIMIQLNYRKFISSIRATIAPKLTNTAVKNNIRKLERTVEEKQLSFLKTYQEAIDNKVQEINTGVNKSSSTRASEVADKIFLDLQHADEKQQQALVDLDIAVTDYTEFLNEKGLISRQQVEEYENKLKNVIANSFYISTTVKKYDTYLNDIGFLGGSLGQGLDQQLNQIADIFKNAGTPIDMEDLKWIRSAILNCFPGSIAREKNKNLIEQYLGSLMAFALFDEGGAETAIISNFYQEYFKAMGNPAGSPSILHLYKTNSIYVPGSLIIKRTLNTLKKEVLPAINKIPNLMTRGAGITIINKTTESVIPNRPIGDNINNPDPAAWSIAGQKASEKIELKIIFLAGLLDIVNGINKSLGNIEMPS